MQLTRTNVMQFRIRAIIRRMSAITLLALLLLPRAETYGQVLSPYSDFESMTPQQLVTLQVKLTYVGVQTRSIPSRVFTTPSNTVDANVFTPFHRAGISYANDAVAVTSTATVSELKAIIDNVGTLPNVRVGGVGSPEYLSFSLFNSQPNNRLFESNFKQN